MSADVISLDGTRAVLEALEALSADIEAGKVEGLCLVAIHRDAGFVPVWHASHTLGAHAGSILRGAVCWLGAEMDTKARA